MDVKEASGSGDLLLIDAREALATFMLGQLPDADRFRLIADGSIEKAARGRGQIRAYGEMVDLVWRDGNPELDAAAALQEDQVMNDPQHAGRHEGQPAAAGQGCNQRHGDHGSQRSSGGTGRTGNPRGGGSAPRKRHLFPPQRTVRSPSRSD